MKMHICLSKSLTEEGHLKIVDESDRYRVNRVTIETLMFMLLMLKAVIDTRATTSYLRKNLTLLEAYMSIVN